MADIDPATDGETAEDPTATEASSPTKDNQADSSNNSNKDDSTKTGDDKNVEMDVDDEEEAETDSNTSSSDDDSSSDNDSNDDDNENGLSKYERMRLERIARNEARLASLGFNEEEKKPKRAKQKPKARTLPEGPTRTLPGRSVKMQFYENMHSAREKRYTPKVVEEEKNPDACCKCQSEEGELFYCEFCSKLYHPNCHFPPIATTNNGTTDNETNNETAFRCTDCETSGKTRRVACGQCIGCKRVDDCFSCVNCVKKFQSGKATQKCIFRKCQSWGKGKVAKDDEEEKDIEHNDECHVCNEGGDLILCDNCPKSYHSNCHKPKIYALPEGEWHCMHCQQSKEQREKTPKYTGPLVADLDGKEVACIVKFPKIQCVLCDGEEVTGVHRPPDWASCKTCHDSYHCKCLSPPLESTPVKWRCPPCRQRKATVKKESKPLFEGESSDWCYVCDDGGDLLCCDYCEKAFHLPCHIPPLDDIPKGNWKCCECAAVEYKRKMNCGECEACMQDDCGKCTHCLDKPKFGGPGKMKQTCKRRQCPFKRFARPASQTPKALSKKEKKEIESKFKAAASSTKKRKRNVSPTPSSLATPIPSKQIENGIDDALTNMQVKPRPQAMKTPRLSPLNSQLKVAKPAQSSVNDEGAAASVTKMDGSKLNEPSNIALTYETPKRKPGRPFKTKSALKASSIVDVETPDGKQGKVGIKTEKADTVGTKMKALINKALKQIGDSKVQDKALEHIRKLITSAEDVEKMIQLGGLKMIANAMRAHSGVTIVQAEANCTLSELLWKSPTCISAIFQEGLLLLILVSMNQHGTHLKVQQMSCGFWRSLSYDFEEHKTIHRVNGVQAVVDSMKRNSKRHEILKEGCFFIQNIVCNPEVTPETVNLIVSSGLIPIVVDAIRAFSTKNDFVEAACGALTNLAIDENARAAIGKYEISIDVILSILESNVLEEDVLRSSLSALKVLAKENEENKERLVQCGAIERTLSFLDAHPDDVYLVARGFGLLIELTKNSNDNSQTVMDANGLDGFDFITSQMSKHPDSVCIQAGGCGLLRNLPLTSSDQANVARGLILAAMKNHTEDCMIQFEGCHALLQFCSMFPSLATSLQSKENAQILRQSHLMFDTQNYNIKNS